MYKINEDFFYDATDLQTVFVDVEHGIFYLLPVFANLVLNMLLIGKNTGDINDAFSKIDNIPLDYKSRIADIIKKLLKYELIVQCDETQKIDPMFITSNIIQELQESDFAYEIKPSDDVQSLLLDDPIHDVSLDGWNPIAK